MVLPNQDVYKPGRRVKLPPVLYAGSQGALGTNPKAVDCQHRKEAYHYAHQAGHWRHQSTRGRLDVLPCVLTGTMEESAPKRKRLSPIEATASSDRDAPVPASTPSRPRAKRPSFASPTKASLARHNPQILERRRSASPVKSSPARPAQPSADLASNRTAGPADTSYDIPASEPAEDSPRSPPSDSNEDNDDSAPSARRFKGGLASTPLRSQAKPAPRPLPPPEPEGEDENPFLGRALRRSPVTGISFPAPPEPELPPSAPDPITSTPPRGIHSSPLRWRDKGKAKKSSPLKAPPLRPAAEPRERLEQLAQDNGAPIDSSTDSARRVLRFDPNLDKRKERDSLRNELASLKKDLSTVRKENERIRLMQASGRILAATDEDNVVAAVRRHLMPRDANVQQITSQDLLKKALKPLGLLPVSKPRSLQSFVDLGPEDYSDIKSHHPVVMTAREELPYLQLFSEFTVDSNSGIAMLPSTADYPLRQRYSITLRSRNIPGLFSANIIMIVNAMNHTILELDVPSLEPAAKAELRPFIDKICMGDCNRSMQKNVGILSWAMGEWVRIAGQRALLWAGLEKELTSKGDLLDKIATYRAQKSQPVVDEEDELSNEAPISTCKRADLLRFIGQQAYELSLPSSGGDASACVRLEWKIVFDWSGEASSKLSVKLGVPGKWRKSDQRGALGKLPQLFDDLVDGGEKTVDTIKTMLGLLVGVTE
ncbi:hypothetical protein S40288_03647 [Stachybotrys chartarum IBT 40288]|nr:hypothetical protein S40288_03647 [Stachybotrys chartarum IBT 40288]